MNEVLRSFIEKFVMVCFDDILMYGCDEDSQVEHLSLYAKLERYDVF